MLTTNGKSPDKNFFGFTLLLGGLALCGAGLWLLLSPAQYQATAIIKVEPDAHDTNFVQSAIADIQSPVVLSNVVADLNSNEAWGQIHENIQGVEYSSMPEKLETLQEISLLRRLMDLRQVRNSKLILIGVSSKDADEAARIANAIAKDYLDYRLEMPQKGFKALEDETQKTRQDIETKTKNLEQLRKQLNLTNSETSDDLLKTNYPSYFQAKQELQQKMDSFGSLMRKLMSHGFDHPLVTTVEIIDDARPPKFPVSPNRPLGAALLAIGFFTTVGGFLFLKSFRRQLH